mgnify:CR=1 FL=1
MAKFIKFICTDTAAVQPLGPLNPILINVEKIQSYAATGGPGGNAKTLVVGLDNGGIATGTPQNPDNLSLTVSTSSGGAIVNPSFVSGSENPLVKALVYAIQANPGGVVATVKLGLDQAPIPLQMYFRAGTLS